MNYGLESSSGIRYDVQHQTYIQERQGMTYKLDKETQQWIPLDSYTDETHHIKYTFSKKYRTWIPDQSTYSTTTEEGQEQTFVWLKDQLKWCPLSTVDAYTDHITGIKYRWNHETQSWVNEGVDSVEDLLSTVSTNQTNKDASNKVENIQKKPAEGLY